MESIEVSQRFTLARRLLEEMGARKKGVREGDTQEKNDWLVSFSLTQDCNKRMQMELTNLNKTRTPTNRFDRNNAFKSLLGMVSV